MGSDLTEQHHPGVADAQTQRAAGDREEQALGNQLTNHAAAPGADREPQRHLAGPHRCAARQEPATLPHATSSTAAASVASIATSMASGGLSAMRD